MEPELNPNHKPNLLLLVIVIGLFINVLIVDGLLIFRLMQPQEPSDSPASTIQPQIVNEILPTGSAVMEKNPVSDTCPVVCLENINQAVATLSGRTETVTRTETVYRTITPATQHQTTYLPLGGSGTTTSQNWTSVASTELTFDKNDYPGAQFYFEAFVSIKQSAGIAYIRLYDKTHNNGLIESERSAGTDIFTKITSGELPLAEGNTTYQVQIKSSNGYDVSMEGARIRVEY